MSCHKAMMRPCDMRHRLTDVLSARAACKRSQRWPRPAPARTPGRDGGEGRGRVLNRSKRRPLASPGPVNTNDREPGGCGRCATPESVRGAVATPLHGQR